MASAGAGILDNAGAIRRGDSGGMLEAIGRLPEQIRDGWARTRGLTLPPRYREVHSVLVLGMGGSAIGAELARSIFADRLRLPMGVLRDYELPAFAGPDTLVVASSHSGATEETVSALTTALERRCPVVIVTTGGPLAEVARRAELPLLTFPGGGQPRAAVGYSLMLLAGLLERLGVLPLGDDEVAEAVAACSSVLEACSADVPTERNLAKQLAWTLVDRLPVIEASGFLTAVARRWKGQLNENSKTMAVVEELPEATHNAVVGYGRPETLGDHVFVVFLAGGSDHPRNTLRAGLSAELLGEARIGHEVVAVPGTGRLAQAAAGIAIGDLASLFLASLYGLDPTPVDAISRIKGRLASAADDSDDDSED